MKLAFVSKLKGKSCKTVYFYGKDKVIQVARRYLYKKRMNLYRDSFVPTKVRSMAIYDFESTEKDIKNAEKILEHIFDLLGSGPHYVNIEENNDYFVSKKEVYEYIRSLNPRYHFIDWQLDFRNNYRYSINDKSKSIRIGEVQGREIKVPWELSRCQHLPYLARIYGATKDIRYKNEILCEILDFIISNPIEYGVNWLCTMDVGIRVANWIMAFDILVMIDGIDEYSFFVSYLKKAIYEHCVFIRYHLEDTRGYRGNHYLSDIVGLIFALSWFDEDKWINKQQIFAVKKLLLSIDEQFYIDGGNFESSLPYHKLSLELSIYGMWRILSLSNSSDMYKIIYQDRKLLERVCQKINCAINILHDSTKPNFEIYQLGDNDSGHLFRFFKNGTFVVNENYIKKYEFNSHIAGGFEYLWDENELDNSECIQLINAIRGFSDNKFFIELIGKIFLRSRIGELLCKVENSKIKPIICDKTKEWEKDLLFKQQEIYRFEKRINIDSLKMFYYPNFGIVGWRDQDFYLCISLTDTGQGGRGGHSHNDKLSFELQVHGIDIVTDPGTYVYTESIEQRNKFRSVLAHNVPYFGIEPNEIARNCFEMKQDTHCKLLSYDSQNIVVGCKYRGIRVMRKFIVLSDKLIVEDMANKKFVERPKFEYCTKGYGKRCKVEV